MNRKPSATNAPRQARLRERRKAEGWRRITVWLSPEQAGRLETLGGDAWLGRTVKALLTRAVADPRKPPAPVSGSGGEPREPATRGKAVFMTPEDKAALMAEVDSLLAQGLSSHAIARKFNAEGRRTVRGSPFYGPMLLQQLRKWKGER